MFYQKEFNINASIENVWNVLTNPEQTKQYMFGCEVLSDWKVDSTIIWKATNQDGSEIIHVKGHILELKQMKHISFTMFDPNMGIEDIPENYLTLSYDLNEKGSATLLTIQQGDFSKIANGEKRMDDSAKGWDMVIPMMKSLIEK